MVGELLRLSVVVVALSHESLIAKDALLFSIAQCQFLDLFLQAKEWSEFFGYGAGDFLGHLDLLLAAWARHESKCDPQRCPSMLQELNDAVGVESMSAGESGARLSAELARVANRAKLE